MNGGDDRMGDRRLVNGRECRSVARDVWDESDGCQNKKQNCNSDQANLDPEAGF